MSIKFESFKGTGGGAVTGGLSAGIGLLGKDEIISLLKKYGKTEKETKSLLKK